MWQFILQLITIAKRFYDTDPEGVERDKYTEQNQSDKKIEQKFTQYLEM